jgi:hypothetical protein
LRAGRARARKRDGLKPFVQHHFDARPLPFGTHAREPPPAQSRRNHFRVVDDEQVIRAQKFRQIADMGML